MNFRILLSSLGLALFITGCEQSNQSETTTEELARPAKIVTITQQANDLNRTYPGVLEATDRADLAFRVAGELIELPAEPGLEVTKGQLLAKLDPKDFENAVQQQQARYNLAKTQLDQVTELNKRKLASKSELDRANAEIQSAEAALKIAKNNLAYSTLEAPFDGVIAQVNIENFQSVTPQVPVIGVRGENQMEIKFSVPETILSQLKRTDDRSAAKNFCGEVRIATRPDNVIRACHKEHETVADAVTRTFMAKFTLEDVTEFVILPGMTATISLDFSVFSENGNNSSVYAPIEAIFDESGKQYVWTVNSEMRATKQLVELGTLGHDAVQITSGLSAGEKVIAAGVTFVREGMLVKPIVKQRGI